MAASSPSTATTAKKAASLDGNDDLTPVSAGEVSLLAAMVAADEEDLASQPGLTWWTMSSPRASRVTMAAAITAVETHMRKAA